MTFQTLRLLYARTLSDLIKRTKMQIDVLLIGIQSNEIDVVMPVKVHNQMQNKSKVFDEICGFTRRK